MGADLHRLLRRLRLPARQAQHGRFRLHARPGIPGAAGAGAVARLRAVGLWRGTLGPQAHAGRLPDPERGRVHAVQPGYVAGRRDRFHLADEFLVAGYVGRLVRVHARGLPDRPARQRHGHGGGGGTLRRPVCAGHHRAHHDQPLHAVARRAVQHAGGGRRRHLVGGRGVAQPRAGVIYG
ncbi:hypothetical protein G6F22_015767 [Rhizopus arrhizus]|nr:hypothetical protein G6F22_015767 [Rhizopus arrhizus]